MFNLKIIAIGKIKNKSLFDLEKDYQQRLKPFSKIKIEELKPEIFSKFNKEKAKKIESEKIKSVLSKHLYDSFNSRKSHSRSHNARNA